MNYYTVYKTINLINGKFYIGKHKTSYVDDSYLGSGKLLKQAIEKYGEDNFVKVVLAVYDNARMMDLAEKILVVFDDPNSYNLKKGGEGGFDYINENMVNFHKGKTYEEIYGVEKAVELKIKLSKKVTGSGNPMFGKKHHLESNLKNSISQKGKKRGPFCEEHKRKIANSSIGKKGTTTGKKRYKKVDGGFYFA